MVPVATSSGTHRQDRHFASLPSPSSSSISEPDDLGMTLTVNTAAGVRRRPYPRYWSALPWTNHKDKDMLRIGSQCNRHHAVHINLTTPVESSPPLQPHRVHRLTACTSLLSPHTACRWQILERGRLTDRSKSKFPSRRMRCWS